MTGRVAKVDLIDQETHGKWPTSTEVIILVSDVNVLYIYLDAVEERREEGETDRLLELLVIFFVLFRFI